MQTVLAVLLCFSDLLYSCGRTAVLIEYHILEKLILLYTWEYPKYEWLLYFPQKNCHSGANLLVGIVYCGVRQYLSKYGILQRKYRCKLATTSPCMTVLSKSRI